MTKPTINAPSAMEQVVAAEGLEQLQVAKGLFAKAAFSGANVEGRNKILADTLCDGIQLYINELVHHALRLHVPGLSDVTGSRLAAGDIATAFERSEVTDGATTIVTFNYKKITKEKVTEWYDNGQISATQAGLLYQAALQQNLWTLFKKLQQHGFYYQNNIINCLEFLNNLDSSSKFLVDMSKKDPNSFRVFQILNHYAKAQLTAEFWHRIVQNNQLDTTVEEQLEGLISGLVPKKEGVSHEAEDGAIKGSLDELKDAFFNQSLQVALDQCKDLKIASKISGQVLPGFFAISNSDNELRKLNVIIVELLSLEISQNFKLTFDYFKPWVDAGCRGMTKQDSDKRTKELKRKITAYITFARELRNARTAQTTPSPLLGMQREIDHAKENRVELLQLIDGLTALQRKEQDKYRVVKHKEQDEILKIIGERFPRLTSAAEVWLSSVDLAEGVKGAIRRGLQTVGDQDNAVTLVKMSLENLNTEDSSRARFYINLLEDAKKALVRNDLPIIKRLDAENDFAQSLLANTASITAIITEGAHYGVFGGKVINPTEFSLAKPMGFTMTARLKTIHEIEIALPKLEKILADNDDLGQTTDLLSTPVRQAHIRLMQSVETLKTRKLEIERSNILLVIKSLNVSLANKLKVELDADRAAQSNFFSPVPDHVTVQREADRQASTQVLRARISTLIAELSADTAFIPEINKLDADIKVLANAITVLENDIAKCNDETDLAIKNKLHEDKSRLIKEKEKLENQKSTLIEQQKTAHIKICADISNPRELYVRITALLRTLDETQRATAFDFFAQTRDLVRVQKFYEGEDSLKAEALVELLDKPLYQENVGFVPEFLKTIARLVVAYNIITKTFSGIAMGIKMITRIIIAPIAMMYKYLALKRHNNQDLLKKIDDLLVDIRSKHPDMDDYIVQLEEIKASVGTWRHSYNHLRFESYEGVLENYNKSKEALLLPQASAETVLAQSLNATRTSQSPVPTRTREMLPMPSSPVASSGSDSDSAADEHVDLIERRDLSAIIKACHKEYITKTLPRLIEARSQEIRQLVSTAPAALYDDLHELAEAKIIAIQERIEDEKDTRDDRALWNDDYINAIDLELRAFDVLKKQIAERINPSTFATAEANSLIEIILGNEKLKNAILSGADEFLAAIPTSGVGPAVNAGLVKLIHEAGGIGLLQDLFTARMGADSRTAQAVIAAVKGTAAAAGAVKAAAGALSTAAHATGHGVACGAQLAGSAVTGVVGGLRSVLGATFRATVRATMASTTSAPRVEFIHMADKAKDADSHVSGSVSDLGSDDDSGSDNDSDSSGERRAPSTTQLRGADSSRDDISLPASTVGRGFRLR